MKYTDIKNTFKDKENIIKEYTERQEKSKNDNEKIAKEILSNFSMLVDLNIPNNLSDTNKLNYLITLILNSEDPSYIKKLYTLLNYYKYNSNCELLKAMIKTDYLLNMEISFKEYELLVKGISITNPYMRSDVAVSIDTAYGRTDLFKINLIEPDARRGFCHDITSDVLRNRPNLYGAYYYIPMEFKGALEHSVIICKEKNLVYDFANNIAVPLPIWTRYYGEPSILIKGDTFIELDKKCQDNLGFCLTTWHLEETKRTRRK